MFPPNLTPSVDGATSSQYEVPDIVDVDPFAVP